MKTKIRMMVMMLMMMIMMMMTMMSEDDEFDEGHAMMRTTSMTLVMLMYENVNEQTQQRHLHSCAGTHRCLSLRMNT